MTNHQRTAQWLQACGKEPGNAKQLSTQVGVHLEEFVELLQCLRVDSDGGQLVLDRTAADMEWLAIKLKRGDYTAHIPNHMRLDALDALCDCEVTGNGVAFLAGFNKDAADQEVLHSNDSKLVDGKAILEPGGKIQKPKGWTPPDLTRFV